MSSAKMELPVKEVAVALLAEEKPSMTSDTEEDVSADYDKNKQDKDKSQDVRILAATSLRAKLRDSCYQRMFVKTVWLNLSLFALGISFAQLGPALLDLQLITNTNMQQASAFVTAGSAGYVMGSFLAGFVYDLLSKSLLLIVSVVLMGVLTLATPYCANYWLMVAAHFLESSFGGSVETTGNADVIRTWGGEAEAEAAMQAIHFSFALGGVIGPLITEPFLAPRVDNLQDAHGWSPLANSSAGRANVTSPTASSGEGNWSSHVVSGEDSDIFASGQTRLHYAYLISALVAFFTAFCLLADYVRRRQQKGDQSFVSPSSQAPNRSARLQMPPVLYGCVLMWVCAIYLLHQGVEDTFTSYLASYVVLQLQWSKSEGAQITSVFWISFAASRFACIFLVKFLSCVRLLAFCFLIMLTSLLAFLLASLWQLHWGVWVSSSLAGAAMSAIFPTGLTWMDGELLSVTGRTTSAIMLASSLGLIINPMILGHLMENQGAIWLAYVLLGETAVCVLIFFLLLLFSRGYLQRTYAVPREACEITPNRWPPTPGDSAGFLAKGVEGEETL